MYSGTSYSLKIVATLGDQMRFWWVALSQGDGFITEIACLGLSKVSLIEERGGLLSGYVAFLRGSTSCMHIRTYGVVPGQLKRHNFHWQAHRWVHSTPFPNERHHHSPLLGGRGHQQWRWNHHFRWDDGHHTAVESEGADSGRLPWKGTLHATLPVHSNLGQCGILWPEIRLGICIPQTISAHLKLRSVLSHTTYIRTLVGQYFPVCLDEWWFSLVCHVPLPWERTSVEFRRLTWKEWVQCAAPS